ncbi:MFS transporter [Aquirufa sp. ROCK-SH2]
MSSDSSSFMTINDEKPMSWHQILIVAICFILNFNDGIDVFLVSFAASEITAEWQLTNAEMGYVFSSGLAGMTIGCFLLAPLGDSIGRRKIFLISLFLISLGMVLVYFVENFSQMLIYRFITGFGIGGILPNLATVASEFSNKKSKDFNVGIVQAGWPLGAILTGFVAAWVVPAFGWRFAFLCAGIFSAVMFVIVLLFLTESPAYLQKKQSNEIAIKPMRILLSPEYRTSTILLWTGIFFGFLTLYTVLSWVPTLAKSAGMPYELATYVGATLNLGAFTGVFVMGLSIGKWGIRKVMLVFMLMAFSLMVLYGSFDLNYLARFILTFFIGFFVQGGFNIFYPASTRIYSDNVRSTGVGLAMGIGRFGAIVGPTLFGIMSDEGYSILIRFVVFSLPLLVAAFIMQKIPSKNLS